MPSALAEPGAAEARLKRLYGVETLDGFGGLTPAEVSALGLLAAHLETTQGGRLPALRPPRRAAGAEVMSIDPRRGPAWRSNAPAPAVAKARCWPASTAR
jgi:DNA mismatch repair protein MutS